MDVTTYRGWDLMTTRISRVIQHLRRTALLQDASELTDGQLLGRFVSRQDVAALEVLARRLGPMVWGVCGRILRNHHDVEDAYQATFLVLVRKAGSIVPREMVGNWLYGVAHQTALKARATTAKRRVRERQVAHMPEPVVTEQDLCRDLQSVLDQELSRLPHMYRVAIVLCDLEGKTRKEAAKQLGCPEGTLAARLTRGRVMLAKRLVRHSLTVSGGAMAGLLSQQTASACVPTSVVSSTIKAVTMVAAGQEAATGAISVKVAVLAQGVIHTMFLNKLKTCILAVLLTLVGVGGGAIALNGLARTGHAQEPAAELVALRLAKDTATPKPLTDPEDAIDKPKAPIPTVWGKPVRGLQAGIRANPDEHVSTAVMVLEVVVRNVSKEVIEFNCLPLAFGGENSEGTMTAKGVEVSGGMAPRGTRFKVKVAPGEWYALARLPIFRPGEGSGWLLPKPKVRLGENQVGAEGVVVRLADGKDVELATGYLDVQITSVKGKLRPLTSKDLIGTWCGEKDGMKIKIVFAGAEDATWMIDTGKGGLTADLKRVDKESGSVQLRFDSMAKPDGTVLGHLERGEAGMLKLTILPVATKVVPQYKPVEEFPLNEVKIDKK